MNIALPYENGEIFPHFGKAKQFKIYRLEDGQVVYDGDSHAPEAIVQPTLLPDEEEKA